MEEGLFPRRTQGWLLICLIGIAYFWIYYQGLYTPLYKKYVEAYYRNETIYPAKDCQNQEVVLYAQVPKFISEISDRRLTLTVVNKSDSDIEQLVLWVSPLDGKGAIGITALTNPNVQANIQMPAYIEFVKIPRKGEVTSFFNLFVKDKMSIEKRWLQSYELQFYLDGVILDQKTEITYNFVESLRHAFIERILLPPWSNIFLAVATLLITKLVEDFLRLSPNDDPNQRKYNKSKLNDPLIVASFGLLITILLGFGWTFSFFSGITDLAGLSSEIKIFWTGKLDIGIFLIVVGYMIGIIFRYYQIKGDENSHETGIPNHPHIILTVHSRMRRQLSLLYRQKSTRRNLNITSATSRNGEINPQQHSGLNHLTKKGDTSGSSLDEVRNASPTLSEPSDVSKPSLEEIKKRMEAFPEG